MINIVVLQDTLNPISAQERVKINENWDALRRGFSSLQNQINFLSGGTEVDEIVARIEQTIQDAQTNTQNAIDNVNNNYAEKLVEINQSLEDLATALTNTQTATTEANAARDNAISATNDAQSAIANVLDIINDLRAVGEWNTTTNYKRNNLVSFDGQTYIALVDNVNTPLTNTSTWSLFAAKGSKGDKGDIGETGAALSIQGRLNDQSELPATGEAGQAYTINGELWVWSENVMQWENVGNIKGEKGDTGDVGPQGPPGETPDLTPYVMQLDDHESRIFALENEEVTVKADVSGLNREVAYLKLRQQASDRIEGGTVFADDFLGSRFGIVLNENESVNAEIVNGRIEIATREMSDISYQNALVTNENASVEGTNGRKVTLLENGWIVAATKSVGSYKLHVNKNDENGFVPLCNLTDAAIVANNDIAIASNNNNVYVIATHGNNVIRYLKIDALTQENVNLYSGSSFSIIETGQTALRNLSIQINKLTNELHATWSSRNATYGSSNNIRYAKASLNNEGVATWSTPLQISSLNTGGVDLTNPSVVLYESKARLVCVFKISSEYRIVSFSEDLTPQQGDDLYRSSILWGLRIIYQPGTYLQTFNSATIDANGVIHAVFSGYNAQDNVNLNLLYSSSNDGGNVWTETQRIGLGSKGTITASSNGDIFVAYESADSVYFVKRASTENTWSTPTVIANGTSPSILDDNTLTYTNPFVLQSNGNSVVANGILSQMTRVFKTNGTVVYNIPATDYVGVFVNTIGDLTVSAFINGMPMSSSLNGKEYTFEGSLSVAAPVTLMLQLNRTDISNGPDDAITRILGGRS